MLSSYELSTKSYATVNVTCAWVNVHWIGVEWQEVLASRACMRDAANIGHVARIGLLAKTFSIFSKSPAG